MGLSLQTTPFTSQTVIYAFVNIKIWISAALISLFVVVVWFFRQGFSSVVVVVCNLWKCHWKQFSFSFPFLQTHNETTSQVQCKGITKPTHLVQNELKHKHYNKPTTQFQYSITLSSRCRCVWCFLDLRARRWCCRPSGTQSDVPHVCVMVWLCATLLCTPVWTDV